MSEKVLLNLQRTLVRANQVIVELSFLVDQSICYFVINSLLLKKILRSRQDSNLQSSAPEADALSITPLDLYCAVCYFRSI